MANQYGNVNANVLQASKDLQAGTITQKEFSKIVNGSTDGLTKFATGLKNIAINMGAMLVATMAIKAAIYIIDELHVSFEEQKEIVDDLASSIESLQEEYDNLKADPSASGTKLSYLKKQIEYQKDLLDIERERLALKYIDEQVPEFGNKDTGVSGGHVNPTITPEDTVEVDIENNLRKLQQAREQLAKVEDGTNGWYTGTWINQENESLKALGDNVATLKTEYLELAKSRDTIQQYLDDGYYQGANADMARKEVDRIQAELDRLDPIILEAELELGTANYLEAYNKLWDTIQDAGSHPTARDGVMPLDDIDKLITKTQTLNQAFLDGEQTAKEYLDSISNLITDSGLENALSKVGDWNGASTDYLEQVVSGLATQVSDSLMESTGRFMRDESNVQEYVGELESAAEAEMKLLKGLHKLEIETDSGQASLKGLTGETLEAAEAYNELKNELDDLQSVDVMIEVNTNYADLIADYENWTEDMLDTAPIQNYIKDMSSAIAQFAKDNENRVDEIAAKLTESTGKTITSQMLLAKDADKQIATVCGDNIYSVKGMAGTSLDVTSEVISDTSDAVGEVITALADMIESFEYTITATPRVLVEPDVGLTKDGVPYFEFGSYEMKFSGQAGKDSGVHEFAGALKRAGSYLKDNDLTDKLSDSKSYRNNDDNDNNNAGGIIDNPPGTDKNKGSSKDPHIVEVDKYKTLTDAVSEYDRKLEKLERTYDNTDSIEERIGLKQAEIKLYQEQKDAIDALNKARDKEISSNVDKLRSVGFKIDYDPNTESLIIHNREHINSLSQDIIETYEDLLSATDELNDANKDSADQWDELTYSINKASKEIKDLEQEEYEDYIEGAEHVLRMMENRKDAFGKESSVYTNMMNAALKRWKDLATTDYQGNIEKIRELEEQWMDFYDARIEREKELLEMQLDDNDRVLDGVIKVIEDEIKAIDDQIDGLSRANDERKKALDLQKAQAELDKARNQKTRMVLRKGIGWVYETDEDAIREAEENLSDLEYDSKVDKLEKEKEVLEDLKEKWEEIPQVYEDEQNRLLMIEKLGADAEEDILSGRLDVMEDFKDDYIDIQEQIQDKTDELEEHTSQAYMNVIKAFENMAKLAGIGLDTKVPTTQKTQSSWYVGKDGKAPSQAQVGDLVYTKGGTYRIDAKDENGKFTSTKINDISTTPPSEDMWGKKFKETVVEVTDAVTESVDDIVHSNKELIDSAKKQILTDANLQKYISENSKYTADEIAALLDNSDVSDMLSDYTDDNTDATDDNTRALYDFIDALANLELEIPLEEIFEQDPFEDIDFDSLSDGEKSYINQLQDAWEAAKENGNYEFADALMGYIEDFKDGNGAEYIAIGEEIAKLASGTYQLDKTVQIGGKNGDPEATQAYLNNLNWIRGKADWSDEYLDRLDAVEDAIVNGSGLVAEVYKDENGRTSTVIDYADKVNSNVGSSTGNKGTGSSGGSSGGKTSGQQAMDDNKVSQSDRDKIAQAQKDYNDAKAKGDTEGMKEAHDRAESIRNQNGYSGGADGSENIKVTSANTRAVSESTKASTYSGDGSYYAGDASYDAADSVKETAKMATDAFKEAVDSIPDSIAVTGTGSTGTSNVSSGGKGGSSGGGKVTSVVVSEHATITTTKNSDGTTTKTYTDNATGRVLTSQTTKKAKGGINLAKGLYNVDEMGAELIVRNEDPVKGRLLSFEYGDNAVIPAQIATNLMKMGSNPHLFINEAITQDKLQNNQIVYTAGVGQKAVTNHYTIQNVSLPNVTRPEEFWDGLMANVHNEAAQWANTRC